LRSRAATALISSTCITVKPAPFVPRHLRAELPGRLTYQGTERAPLKHGGLPEILDGFRATVWRLSRPVCKHRS